MTKNYFKKTAAFTLVEALVYIAVLVIVISSVIAFLFWAVSSAGKAKSIREVSDNSRRALEVLAYEIREARSIYVPTSSSTQLSLETTKYLPTGESSSYLDFYVVDGVLYMKKESQNPIPLTSGDVEITNIFFEQVLTTTTAPSVQISLDINYKNPSNRPEYSASVQTTSTVSLRNY